MCMFVFVFVGFEVNVCFLDDFGYIQRLLYGEFENCLNMFEIFDGRFNLSLLDLGRIEGGVILCRCQFLVICLYSEDNLQLRIFCIMFEFY